MTKKWFYERNDYLLRHQVNKTFEEVLWMTKWEFKKWCIDLRDTVVYSWDQLGLPPRVGYSETDMIAQFNKMIGFPVEKLFMMKDELDGEFNVIRNTSNLGNAANQFFETMMKTRINYTKKDDGKSIYDYFAKPELLDTFVTYASRHFKRDSFYHYSSPARVNDKTDRDLCCDDSSEWIRRFESTVRKYGKRDYWLAPKESDAEYTGYTEELKSFKSFFLDKVTIEKLGDLIPKKCKTNVDWAKSESYQIRVYDYGQKLFPIGLKAFRVSFCQYAVNFPPLTATLLYKKFTPKEKAIVWDPSCGWGGRILGAMAVDDRDLTYLGCDPNTDHSTENGRTKYHELADFFNEKTYMGNSLFSKTNNYKIWQCGSEEIQFNKEFQEYKGLVDFVFTSPPYFNREGYSEDPTQSYKKFSGYDSWRDGFLKETLKTAYEWLKSGGYIAWNIADLKIGKEYIPLEKDSIDILTNLGMTYITTMKMALMPMPGANRVSDDGKASAKNSCKIKGMVLKFEPILIFQKN